MTVEERKVLIDVLKEKAESENPNKSKVLVNDF